MDMVIGLALLDAAVREFEVARLLLVVIAGIVIKDRDQGTEIGNREQGTGNRDEG
jgi:hypothetical protein